MFVPLTDNNKVDRATAPIGISDVSFNLASGNIQVNGTNPPSKVWLAIDPTSSTSYEAVYATVIGTTVSQMERANAKAHPAVNSQNPEVRLVTAADVINKLQLQSETGWFQVPSFVTATYVSPNSFTLTGDWTSVISKWDKVKALNPTLKQGYVSFTSLASNVTTVGFNGGSDHLLASGSMTSLYFSKASTPSGFPSQFNYGVTLSNVNVGNGTLVGRFSIVGGRPFYVVEFKLGSTSSFTGQPIFSLPVDAKVLLGQNVPIGYGETFKAGVADYPATVWQMSTTTAQPVITNAAGTYSVFANVGPTVPFTFAPNDGFSVRGEYEPV